jgi:hypothetical protein
MTNYPVWDKQMWAKLLRIAHDDETLYRWVQALREHVAGDEPVDVRTNVERRLPPAHKKTGERLDFTRGIEYGTFDELTRRALRIADDDRTPEPYAGLLALLSDCRPAAHDDHVLRRQEREGTTYKSLAAAAFAAGLSRDERVTFYRLAEKVPLSQRHASRTWQRLGQEHTA